jgi:uncharacterized membrane protein YgdD (TMEM256/DUF423 family)
MDRTFFVIGSASGGLAVLFGAFGAHGLRARLGALPDGATRLSWWETAAHYHLVHALAILFAGYLCTRTGQGSAAIAGFCFVLGTVLFSGSLYAMTLTGVRALGAVTPIGGLLLVVGWALGAYTAWKMV